MATFNEIRLALRAINYLDGMRASMRFEAQSFISTLDAGTVLVNGVPTPALGVVQDIIVKDRIKFGTLGSQFQAVLDNPAKLASLTNGMAAINVPVSEAQALKAALTTAFSTLNTSPITTDPQIRAMAASMLATIPTLTSIAPEN